ncbi:MAG: 9-O-acetylesterase, partial [Muribaculaceae bacterium]|nr:9-O-acetylesterase [Muribaculaceae bacterium]
IRKSTAFEPQDDAEVNMGGWRICSPETVSEFSSIAYFFARELNRQLGVHVGVIDATWGGTPAEAWTALGGVETVAGFEKECSMLRDAKGSDKKMNRFHSDRIAAWNAAVNGKKNNFRHSEISANSMKTELPGFVERDIENFNGVFVLQRYVDIPASFAGKDLTLRLAKIDDEDVTYFNGVEVGRTSGYDTPRSYTVPGKLVKAGRNLISIEVTDFEGEGGLYGAPDDLWVAGGETRIPLAGEWGCSVVADFRECAPRPVSPGSSSFPTVLFNAMIHPLKDFPVKGVIWYQGCANVGRAEQYAPLFTNLVKTWRETRRQPDMPFYFMQLAGFLAPKTIQPDSEWAALREAQTAACGLPGVKMATAIDIGNPDDIHPKNKQEAARRFALIALNDAYGFKDVTAYAPVLKSCTMNNGETLLEFDSPVTVDGVAPAGFIACVSSGGWERPEIRMEGMGKVYLRASSPIKEIRYNWADCPDGNLRGFTGLPVAPFKTVVK